MTFERRTFTGTPVAVGGRPCVETLAWLSSVRRGERRIPSTIATRRYLGSHHFSAREARKQKQASLHCHQSTGSGSVRHSPATFPVTLESAKKAKQKRKASSTTDLALNWRAEFVCVLTIL